MFYIKSFEVMFDKINKDSSIKMKSKGNCGGDINRDTKDINKETKYTNNFFIKKLKNISFGLSIYNLFKF
jgi:hypothetical protein